MRRRLARKKSGGQEAQALGRSRGGFSIKIHLSVDALRRLLRFRLTSSERHDITQAASLAENYDFEMLLTDTSYDSAEFIESLKEQGAEAVIPPRRNRKQQREIDRHIYKERHLVEVPPDGKASEAATKATGRKTTSNQAHAGPFSE